jgi:hypothetical protein
MRFFNTAGPVDCKDHYCVPPIDRFNLDELLMLIDQKKYFVLHAPRQTGKTSCLLALMDYLNAGAKFACLYVNVEVGQAARENIHEAMNNILQEIVSRAKIHLKDPFPETILESLTARNTFGMAINHCFTEWAAHSDKPLVVLMDEIDSLVGDTLISVLRQLRSGYDKRPGHFPQSVILCGVRDVRDYRIHSDKEKTQITGGRAFNIKAKSLRLGDFSKNEVIFLLNEHTRETGQLLTPESIELIWELSQGQPWVVNALAYEVCFETDDGKDRKHSITPDMVSQAKENIILRRETHLDQLADKLQEDRIRRVIQPILSGVESPKDIPPDDIDYAYDLGLIKKEGNIRIANPIYREIIPRQLTYGTQLTIVQESAWYVDQNGRLDMQKLMKAFQLFFREHSEIWMERFDYKEAGPQLLLQAFLQRIINAGGRVEREYGLGKKRTDLMVLWKHAAGVQRVVIELKIKYGTLEKTIEEGLEQTSEYMDKCGTDEGHLVIFDRSPDKTWDEKIFQRSEAAGKIILVWGM